MTIFLFISRTYTDFSVSVWPCASLKVPSDLFGCWRRKWWYQYSSSAYSLAYCTCSVDAFLIGTNSYFREHANNDSM